MNKNKTFQYISICALVSSIIYIIGSGTYITYLMVGNNNLLETSKCLDIDISNGIILEKDNNRWTDRYNIIEPVSGYTELKCPTDFPVIYNVFNNSLIGYLSADNVMLNYNISIMDCNNKLKYTMRIGEFIGVYVNNDVLLVSVDIRANNKTLYYIKHDVYKTDNFDLYNNNEIIVANLKYSNKLWNISTYNYTIDYNILLSLSNYHQYYVSGFKDDLCNQYIKISYVLMFCGMMLLCCSCIICVKDIICDRHFH